MMSESNFFPSLLRLPSGLAEGEPHQDREGSPPEGFFLPGWEQTKSQESQWNGGMTVKNGTRQITVEISRELDDTLESILRHCNGHELPEGKPSTKSKLVQDALHLWVEDYIAKFADPQD